MFVGTIRLQLIQESLFKTSSTLPSRHWKVSREDPHLVRFGLLWRLYDEVIRKGLSYQGFLLEDHNLTHHVTLCGGISGTEFLVYASRLNQPRAGRGHIPVGYYEDDQAVGHKTMGIKDCQFNLGFQRWDRKRQSIDPPPIRYIRLAPIALLADSP